MSMYNSESTNIDASVVSPAISSVSTIKVKPQLTGWLIAYIIFSIPGFIVSLLVTVLVFVLIIGTLAGIGSIEQESKKTEQANIEYEYLDGNPNSTRKLLVYNLKGTIYSGGDGQTLDELQSNIYSDKIKRDFQKIASDQSIQAITFKMDTPGGEVIAAEEIADSINDLMLVKKQSKSVFYWDSVVASGGVFITSKVSNNFVVANPYGESGSIGVITRIPDLQGLYDKIGVKWRVYKSSPSKDYGSEARNPSDDENKFIQAQIDKTYNRFVDLVSSGRNIDRAKVLSFSNGFVYPNDESKNLGLVDEIGNLSDAYTKQLSFMDAQVSDYQIVTIKKQTDFFQDIFGPTAKVGLAAALLGVDTSSISTAPKFKSNMVLYDPRFLN